MLRHFSRQVVVATTHKFNLLSQFDEIIVMEKGRVIERGTLAELLKRDGLFSAMWSEFSGAQSSLEAVL